MLAAVNQAAPCIANCSVLFQLKRYANKWYKYEVGEYIASFPGSCVGGVKHAQLPQDFWGFGN